MPEHVYSPGDIFRFRESYDPNCVQGWIKKFGQGPFRIIRLMETDEYGRNLQVQCIITGKTFTKWGPPNERWMILDTFLTAAYRSVTHGE